MPRNKRYASWSSVFQAAKAQDPLGARFVSRHVRACAPASTFSTSPCNRRRKPATRALALAEDLRREHRLSGKPMVAGRLHVSLNPVGEFKHPPGAVVAKVMAGVAQVSVRPFVVEFNRLGSWGRGDAPRKLVLWGEEGVVGVHGLYSALHKALGRIDFAPRRETPIEPHMTLIHEGAELPDRFVEPVGWRATEFVLIHAVHGEGRYEVAGRVPLSG